ncbi:MAG: hypothetical protein AAB729_01185 [Patescibacteria group bacterium]
MDFSFLHLGVWTYVILFFAMFFDANLMIIIGVFVISSGRLNPWLIAGIIISGAYLEQLAWFGVGRLMKKSSLLSRWATKAVGKYDEHLINRSARSLLLTKFIYGTHRATLLRSGMLDIAFKKFSRSSAVAVVFWLGIVGTFGFAFSLSYFAVKTYLKYAEYGLLAIVIIFFSAQYFVSKSLEKEL